MNRTLTLLLLLLLSSSLANAASTTVDFLKLSIGARPTGMGDACVSLCSDISASYWNPAGIALIRAPQAGLAHSEAVIDASLEFIGAAYPLSPRDTVALSGIFYIVKPIPVRLSSGESMGDLNWMDKALIASYGRILSKELSVGTSVKFIQRTESDPIFGSSEGSSFAFDLGIMYHPPFPGIQTGIALLNTGPELRMSGETKKDALPQTTRAGISYSYDLDSRNTLTTALDFNRILDGNWYPSTGIEFGFQKMIVIRTGYYKKDGNIQGITYGMGITVNRFQFDYSNIPASEMVGHTRNNKFSLIMHF